MTRPGTVAKAGEAKLLSLVRRWCGAGSRRPGGGIGDDCATVKTGARTLMTTDAFVEGVHFRREWTPAWHSGWKALAASISDIAAAGGVPTAAVVSLELPPSLTVAWLREFYIGLMACARRFRIAVVGGNLSRSSHVACHIALLGDAPRRRVGRAGARPGDIVAVTGRLGGSLAGLLCLRRGIRGRAAEVARWRHMVPVPRVEAGRSLALVASAMIDVSDGLVHEARLIANESGVAVALVPGGVPVHPAAAALAVALRRDAVELALGSGEEYELLVCVPRRRWGAAVRAARRGGVPLTAVGEVRRGTGVTLAGWSRNPRGFDHFAGCWRATDGPAGSR